MRVYDVVKFPDGHQTGPVGQSGVSRDAVAERRRHAVIGCAGYEIRVTGTLDQRWWEWFEDYAITTESSGETTLSGRVSDQRLLLGTLVTLYELGHALVSITPASYELEISQRQETLGALSE